MSERIRVKDKDTGHERTIDALMLPHGNYEPLDSDAVDPVTGEDVPPKYATPKSVETVKPESGLPARTNKEK